MCDRKKVLKVYKIEKFYTFLLMIIDNNLKCGQPFFLQDLQQILKPLCNCAFKSFKFGIGKH